MTPQRRPCNRNFQVSGYFWVGVWYLIFAADQIFIK
jgi:hypothetical protein